MRSSNATPPCAASGSSRRPRCCTGFEEQRQSFRAVTRSGETVSLADHRRVFQARWAAVMADVAVA